MGIERIEVHSIRTWQMIDPEEPFTATSATIVAGYRTIRYGSFLNTKSLLWEVLSVNEKQLPPKACILDFFQGVSKCEIRSQISKTKAIWNCQIIFTCKKGCSSSQHCRLTISSSYPTIYLVRKRYKPRCTVSIKNITLIVRRKHQLLQRSRHKAAQMNCCISSSSPCWKEQNENCSHMFSNHFNVQWRTTW